LQTKHIPKIIHYDPMIKLVAFQGCKDGSTNANQ
jgi:hypothetical protein